MLHDAPNGLHFNIEIFVRNQVSERPDSVPGIWMFVQDFLFYMQDGFANNRALEQHCIVDKRVVAEGSFIYILNMQPDQFECFYDVQQTPFTFKTLVLFHKSTANLPEQTRAPLA